MEREHNIWSYTSSFIFHIPSFASEIQLRLLIQGSKFQNSTPPPYFPVGLLRKKNYFHNNQSESHSFLIYFKVSDRDVYFHWLRIALYVFIIQFSFISVHKMFLFHFSSASKTCLFCISKIRSQTWRSTEPHAKNLQRVRFIWRGIGFDRMNVFNIIP